MATRRLMFNATALMVMAVLLLLFVGPALADDDPTVQGPDPADDESMPHPRLPVAVMGDRAGSSDSAVKMDRGPDGKTIDPLNPDDPEFFRDVVLPALQNLFGQPAASN